MGSVNILWFKEIKKKDIPTCGGKGASLGEMYNAGIPVPPGFVVTAEAYKNFLDSTGIADEIYFILGNLNVEDNKELQAASKKIQEIIVKAQMPRDIIEDMIESYESMNVDEEVFKKAGKEALSIIKAGREPPFVAVRSSATAEDLPSISKDEHILVKINNKTYFRRMEEIYDLVGDGTGYDIEIPAMKNNKIQWVKVGSLYKHKAKEGDKLYKIKTRTGREITVSSNHSLIILDEDALKTKTVRSINDLRGNEKLPAINKLPALNLNQEIDILNYMSKEGVVEEKSMLKIKNNSTNWKIQSGLPRKLKITKDFAYFLGVYCAEGSTYGSNEIIVTNSKKSIMNRIIDYVSSLGFYKNQKLNNNSLRFYNKTFLRFLNTVAGEPDDNIRGKGKICRNKKVPEFVFGWNEELIGEFLKGCFDGDGYVSKNTIEYCSTSKNLTSGIIKLLEILGIEWHLREKNNAFNIIIQPHSFKLFYKLINSESIEKQKRMSKLIERFTERKNHPELLNNITISSGLSKYLRDELEKSLPKHKILASFCPICKNKIEKTSYYLDRLRFYCKNCHKSFYENDIVKKEIEQYVYYNSEGRFVENMTPWNKGFLSKTMGFRQFKKMLNKNNLSFDILNSSVKWDQIEEIKEISYDDYVYDFCIPNVENFAAGIGGIITHNTASFAGQQATFLNVKGNKSLIKAVQECWASLFTARAIYYRVKNNFPHEKVFIAVVVQKMANSTKSGVIFSINPVTNDESEIVIEAGWGLGEAVVSGSITPDQYIIDKNTLQLKNKKINEQTWMYTLDQQMGYTVKKNILREKTSIQKLTDSEIERLAELTLIIEQHYGSAQDIEYAIEGSNVYIVQSRPVTTLKKSLKKAAATEKPTGMQASEAEVLVQGLGASPGIASGNVKIVHGIDDLGKVLKGDVLVTRMTNPDYVPVMQRASAIVTNEGGTTCFSGKTKILTNKGFMNIETVFDNLKNGGCLKVASFNPKTLKNEWKTIKNPIKRKSRIWKIFVSQTGKSKQNFLEVTLNHKMVALDGRNIMEKELHKMINNSEMLLVADKIPPHFNPHEISEPHLAYLCGALFTDGYIQVNNRRGRVVLTQKEEPEKEQFINTVRDYFYEIFKTGMIFRGVKKTSGIIRGKEINGTASDFICNKKEPASKLKCVKENIIDWVLHLDELSLKSFLGGVIDGDGSFNITHESGRINIYSGKKYLVEGIILACLRLGILPQISIQRKTCYNIQILDEIEELLKNTKRVKGDVNKKILGTKLFSAKQLFKGIEGHVNHKGRIKPYIKNNLLLDGNKIRERILPMLKDKKLAGRINSIINSEFRMQRAVRDKKFEEISDVYNFEVEDNHTYLVFTENYTPVIVWNCHAAIVSREMGIACIVGTENATRVLKENEIVTVDAYAGKVYKGKVAIEKKEEAYELEQTAVETVTGVKVVMDLPEYAEKAAATGADGIGLLRNNLMMVKHGEHPSHMIKAGRKEDLIKYIAEDVSKIAEAFKGKPVWYRTFDAPTDEYRGMKGGEDEPVEANPMMGWRSIRRSLDEPELLLAEFEAIKRVHEAGYTNVGIMIPLVTHVEQIIKTKEYIRQVGLEPMENIEFGIMVETPAAVQMIEEICKEGVDFISFGTNDLTQFTFALDRDNAKVQKLYNEKHPAVLRQIKYVIDTCRKYNVETSICGQAGSDPEMAELLVRMGIDSISANTDAVKKIRYYVAKAEKKLLLNAARKKSEITL